MTARVSLVALALALVAGLSPAALPPRADEVSAAYYAALADLRAGKERRGIADRLAPAVEKHPASPYRTLAGPLLEDLVGSPAGAAKADQPPEARLADTRVPLYLLRHAENWVGPVAEFVKKEPKDPVAELAAADRAAIGRLIPRLTDRTPTRCGGGFGFDWRDPQPRACDVALALIEYHGRCQFHTGPVNGTHLHQLPAADREKVAARVAEWWAEAKGKSVAAGVRAQLSHDQSYPEAVTMAKELARLGEGQKTTDREFALDVLRDMVKQHRNSHVGVSAADALAGLGDLSAVDVFHDECESWLGRPDGNHELYLVLYLCRHGKRREWELLHAIASEGVATEKGKGLGSRGVLGTVVSNRWGANDPFAVPFLALALGQTEMTGAQYIGGKTRPFSSADTACEKLQKQVGRDFGYDPAAPVAERLAAVAKARAWWDAEGEAKYTFESIEKATARKPAAGAKK